MLAVTGLRSKIIAELQRLVPEETIVRIEGEPPQAERYVLAAGLLRPKRLHQQSLAEIGEGLDVNLVRPMEICDNVLARNENARICVIGSESGFAWSYDGVYAASKAALHRYVETKKLKPNQQLVCVAPSIIGDAGMTLARADTKNLEKRRNAHPKKRFLKSSEVAKFVHFLLYVDDGYLSGQVFRMNGGV
jgi:NAD(P)-dependent dehydrogenase (short-subunit alcohol dehydrogenase family)